MIRIACLRVMRLRLPRPILEATRILGANDPKRRDNPRWLEEMAMSTKGMLVYWFGGILGVCGIAAVPLLLSFDVSAFVAAIAGNVGLVGLIGVLYQLLRDEAAHQKEVWLQHDDQLFQVGATSHMANMVFDKHVEFSEEYVTEVQRTVDTLFAHGPHEKALEHANNLQEIRRERRPLSELLRLTTWKSEWRSCCRSFTTPNSRRVATRQRRWWNACATF
jgi:hypothetical protein